MKSFYQILGNTTIASVTNYTVWFALTYYVYLQTHSVFATSIISGIYLVITSVTGFWLGSLVDHHKKKDIMQFSNILSLIVYTLGLIIYITAAPDEFKNPASVRLWILVPLLLIGVIGGNIRNIALPTLVSIMVPEDRRDKANGLVGTAGGISFMIVSVISGFLVAQGGMLYALLLAIVMSVVGMIHLWTITIPEKGIVHTHADHGKIDIKGTIKAVGKIPGLFALIIFTTLNNFLGGVYMSLMDAYGLSMISVERWGLLWGVLSLGFIVGGIIIAKWGLGKNPLKTMFLANILIWTVSSLFTIQASIILLMIGMFIYLCFMPYIEAAEQTIIQRVVPLERQGRVFGFAHSVEQAASPLTAFAIGPLTQFIFIPFMTTGAGVQLIGGWFGTGEARGIALVFTITGIIGLIVTLLAMSTKYYRDLSQRVTTH
jgi:DHA3 family multidrug efflux protein-like MFS transporter